MAGTGHACNVFTPKPLAHLGMQLLCLVLLGRPLRARGPILAHPWALGCTFPPAMVTSVWKISW